MGAAFQDLDLRQLLVSDAERFVFVVAIVEDDLQ
jgi:hypothetical protein